MRRARNKKEIDFSFDSLADIVSNILGILVILGVLISMMSKFSDENKKEEERENLYGKKDALTDLLHKDKRKDIPFERSSRYNRFHLHVICWQDKLYFIDSAEFNLKVNEKGADFFNNKQPIGECMAQMLSNEFSDMASFIPLKEKGFKPLKQKFSSYKALRDFFKLADTFNAKENRSDTKISPNNHVIHFYVFPGSVRAFNIGNDYLRMIGFDTGWELMPKNIDGHVRLPVFLKTHRNAKHMHIQ